MVFEVPAAAAGEELFVCVGNAYCHPLRAKAQNIENVKNTNKGCTIFICSKEEEGVKEDQRHFTTVLNPRQDKIKIRSMRATKNGLVVETETNEDANKILSNQEVNDKLKCELAWKRRPLLILYDIPSDMPQEEVLDTIYEENF